MGFSNYGDVAAALAAESANWSPTAGHTDPAVRELGLHGDGEDGEDGHRIEDAQRLWFSSMSGVI